jgi:hypothetical protein
VVAHRYLEDALAALDEPGGDLGLDREPRGPQREAPEDVGPHRLVAGHQVAQVDVEEHVGHERHELVAHHVQERVARVAVEGAHAEDGVGAALDQRREQHRQVRRLVLEIGVEDRGELTPGRRERGAHGGALAAVAVVMQDAHPLRPAA